MRRRIFQLLVLTIALSAGLGMAELAVRMMSPQQLGFVFHEGRFEEPPEFTPDRTRNSIGFHDVEHGEKKPGNRRLILLGDSYVGASFVALEETVGRRLEFHLNQSQDSAAHSWEVISVGKSGWGQVEELDALRRHGRKIAPDVVLTLFLSLNDVKDNAPILKQDTWLQRDQIDRSRLGHVRVMADEAPCFWFRSSKLNQLLSYRLTYYRRDDSVESIPLPYFVYNMDESPEWQDAWRRTLELLDLTGAFAKQIGARYLLATASTPHGILGRERGLAALQEAYPGMRQGRWDIDMPDRRIAEYASDNGVPCVVLEEPFREATAQGRALHYTYNGHWNAEGNDFAAEALADFVRRHCVITSSAPAGG